jgi:hypothetical protein
MSVGLEIGYSHWNLSWFARILHTNSARLLPWLHLSSTWYRIFEYLDTYCAQCVPCFCRVQIFNIQMWKEHAVCPFDGQDPPPPPFFHDFNMHNHSITQLCITYLINKHHITRKSKQVRICLYFFVWCNKYCQHKIINIFLFQVISCEIFQQFMWCSVWSQVN